MIINVGFADTATSTMASHDKPRHRSCQSDFAVPGASFGESSSGMLIDADSFLRIFHVFTACRWGYQTDHKTGPGKPAMGVGSPPEWTPPRWSLRAFPPGIPSRRSMDWLGKILAGNGRPLFTPKSNIGVSCRFSQQCWDISLLGPISH